LRPDLDSTSKNLQEMICLTQVEKKSYILLNRVMKNDDSDGSIYIYLYIQLIDTNHILRYMLFIRHLTEYYIHTKLFFF